jgi:hypothetical protein
MISIRDMSSTSVRYQITEPRIDVKPAEDRGLSIETPKTRTGDCAHVFKTVRRNLF